MPHGKTLLGHQIEVLAANGVDEVVVVTGFARQMVEEVVSRVSGIYLRMLYSPYYTISDKLGTSCIARQEMKTPFLLVNGDTLFEPSIRTQLLSSDHAYPIRLAVDHKNYDDDMKISADGARLNRVGKKLEMGIVTGESAGMMIFNHAGAEAFVQNVESEETGLDAYFLRQLREPLACLAGP